MYKYLPYQIKIASATQFYPTSHKSSGSCNLHASYSYPSLENNEPTRPLSLLLPLSKCPLPKVEQSRVLQAAHVTSVAMSFFFSRTHLSNHVKRRITEPPMNGNHEKAIKECRSARLHLGNY